MARRFGVRQRTQQCHRLLLRRDGLVVASDGAQGVALPPNYSLSVK